MKVVAREVEMVASFRHGGIIRPHRFRLCEGGERTVVRVDKVVQTEETRLAGVKSIVYTCQSEIAGVERLYQLKYRIDEHRWELYKM
ncbi:MAG: hypothetical protein LBR44_04025 [Clostridiales Family XIII bacterium]|jgi:hypothetical protein|nr:hypothetical protein [Clostridiales Family XIII bacterium]